MDRHDVYDRRGNPTGRIKTREEVWQDDEYLLGASLWIIHPDGRLLIQRRSARKRFMPNLWSITGGAVCAGETSAQGCVREAAEEIGLVLDPGDIDFLYRCIGRTGIHDDFAVILNLRLEDAVLQDEEVAQIRWATAEEIRGMHARGEFMFDDMRYMDRVMAYYRAWQSANPGFESTI